MTPRVDCLKSAHPWRNALSFGGVLILIPLFFGACFGHKLSWPGYAEFTEARKQAIPGSLLEIYGRYSASTAGASVHSRFNLLLDPGKNAYLEILSPSNQLLYAVSISPEEVVLLWAQDQDYIREKASPENLNAIAGLPILADDLLFLVAGYGLNFGEWSEKAQRKEGWQLSRSLFLAELTLQEDLSRIRIDSPEAPELITRYDRYRLLNNRRMPLRIRFEIPARKISIRLELDKWIPRDEQPSQDLFAVRLPDHAERLLLKDIYHGKPLLLQ